LLLKFTVYSQMPRISIYTLSFITRLINMLIELIKVKTGRYALDHIQSPLVWVASLVKTTINTQNESMGQSMP